MSCRAGTHILKMPSRNGRCGQLHSRFQERAISAALHSRLEGRQASRGAKDGENGCQCNRREEGNEMYAKKNPPLPWFVYALKNSGRKKNSRRTTSKRKRRVRVVIVLSSFKKIVSTKISSHFIHEQMKHLKLKISSITCGLVE